jgi:hypothetical protein
LLRTSSLAFIPLFFISAVLRAEPVQTKPAQPSPGIQREKYLMAQSFLGEKLWLWQNRLNLGVWNIQIRLVRLSELKPKTLGNIHWDTDTHTAQIKVLAPEDYKVSSPDMLKDMEFTVVHELIHLELSSLPRSEASRSAEEHAVNQIAQALLNLDRQ